MAQKPPPIWEISPFAALLADPFVQGTELEGGHIANGLQVTLHLLARAIKHPERLPLLKDQMKVVESAGMLLKDCVEMTIQAAKEVKDAASFTKYLEAFLGKLSALKQGEVMLIPGGWTGLTSTGSLMHIVERTGIDTFSFVTCNTGTGLQYHPSSSAPSAAEAEAEEAGALDDTPHPKLRYRTCIRLDDISGSRMLDPAFWSVLFSLWLRDPPSEFHRVEAVYDVLLPWLSDTLLPTALAKTANDPAGQFRTPQRSGTSSTRVVVESLRYVLLRRGVPAKALKQLTFALKREMVDLAEEELTELVRLHEGGAPAAANEQPGPSNSSHGLEGPQPAPSAQPTPGQLALAAIAGKGGKLLSAGGAGQMNVSSLQGKVVGLYFSAHWCPPCRGFTPQLIAAYNKLSGMPQKQPPLEIVFVSSDRDERSFQAYFGSMPWLALPFEHRDVAKQLSDQFGVSGIPTLVIMGPDGKILCPNARASVAADPDCDKYPWGTSSSQASSSQGGGGGGPEEVQPLAAAHATLLRLGCETLALAAIKESKGGRLPLADLQAVQHSVENVQRLVARMPKAKTGAEPALPPTLDASLTGALLPFPGVHLLAGTGMDKYAGKTANPSPPELANLLDVPERVRSLDAALLAIKACDNVCKKLLERAGAGGLGLVVKYQVIELIGALFTTTLPMPRPRTMDAAHDPNGDGMDEGEDGEPQAVSAAPVLDAAAGDIWAERMTKKIQMETLEIVYRLALTFGTAWQAVEIPNRAFDSERSVVSACMLAIFDVVLRTRAADNTLIMTTLLLERGGCAFSTAVCQNSRSFAKVASTQELTQPHLVRARGHAMEYLTSVDAQCGRKIFDFRMPEKVEVKKYGATVLFLRSLLERCGYELTSRQTRNPPPEMESLMEWLLGDNTPLAQHESGRAFHMARDMVYLFKFLATMETREAELLRKRHALREMQRWTLSFDQGGRRGMFAWRRRGFWAPLQWEAVNFRGQDIDTADVEVVGLGGRKLFYGEGPVVQSPSDCSAMLKLESPTEDDVLHADSLPDFGNTLSVEESTTLLSYLTVDYVRIPLVLGFFASRDRVTYLFNAELQALLRSVLFEAGQWVAPTENAHIDVVPVRMTVAEQEAARAEEFLNAKKAAGKPGRLHQQKLLGTSSGLLLNELRYAPAATLDPVLRMLNSVRELGRASVHSPDATFILFMISLAVDVQGYVVDVLGRPGEASAKAAAKLPGFLNQLKEFLHGPAADILERWRVEAEDEADLPTASVVHGYLALLWAHQNAADLTAENLGKALGSIAYVRNWHGFGMGQLRSQMEVGGDSEKRLTRFLQAQGIDTSESSRQGSLTKWIQSGRPVYLNVGHESIRAPTFISADDARAMKLPPADVPEAALFAMLQRQRYQWVKFASKLGQKDLSGVLNSALKVALKKPGFETAWKSHGPEGLGRFAAQTKELTVDLQTAEVMWRNDRLQPVPDSMAQFSDFEALFGRESLHCGVVARQDKRLWVHVVGTECDLQEWTEPDPEDQGVGCPAPPPEPVVPNLGFWACQVCTFANQDMQAAACGVCGSPRPDAPRQQGRRRSARGSDAMGRGGAGAGRMRGMFRRPEQAYDGAAGSPMSRNRQQQGGGASGDGEDKKDPGLDEVVYNGVTYKRKFNAYDEAPHPEKSEQWVVNLVGPVILAHYPKEKPLQYNVLLPEKPLAEDADVARLLGCWDYDKEDATWKEIEVLRHRGVVHVYNLVPHGRRMYRQLVYTSRCSFALMALPPNTKRRSRPLPPCVANQAGDFKRKRTCDPSLVIVRKNDAIGGIETYMPPRLLQGLIPSVLLEAFEFWQGEDQLIRGRPHDETSQWFGYSLEVHLVQRSEGDWRAVVKRRAKGAVTKMVEPRLELAALKRALSTQRRETQKEEDSKIAALVPQLTQLGFTEHVARMALRNSDNSVIRATDWLFDETNAYAIDLANVEAQEIAAAEQQAALEAAAAAEAVEAASAASSGQNDDKMQVEGEEEEEKDQDAPEAGMEVGASDDEEEANDIPDLTLLNLLHCKKESALYRLASTVSRIEDLSHVLCWTRADLSQGDYAHQEQDDSAARVEIVELPRLKVKFQPRRDAEGCVRLYLLDQAGWFVSDALTSDESEEKDAKAPDRMQEGDKNSGVGSYGARFLKPQLESLPHCLLLENRQGELQVMVPNHDVHRPVIAGQPFSTALVFDRASLGWQETMETRYYVYPVHTSRTFLHSATLASTLYLILLRLLNRDYAGAFRLIDSCTVDVDFTAEEEWVWVQLERTLTDKHPDAHACRLKLLLAVMYSENRVPWEAQDELDPYLHKLPHVSAACTLSAEEEMDAVYQCKQSTPRIKNQLAMVEARKERRPKAVLKPHAPRWGGQPWMKMCMYGIEYLERHGTHITRMHYKRPAKNGSSELSGEEAVDLVWSNLVIADEESGANRQLGFVYLYELLRGQSQVTLLGQDVTHSMAELLTRFFHLKQVRWGKEQTDVGEQEGTASYQMAILAALASQPQHAAWPHVPRDDQTARLLAKGLDLHSKQAVRSMVSVFRDTLKQEFRAVMRGEAHALKVENLRTQTAIIRTQPLSQGGAVAVRRLHPGRNLGEPSDTSCASRVLKPLTVAADEASSSPGLELTGPELAALGCDPLSPVDLPRYIQWEARRTKVSSDLPFDVTNHSSARSAVAKDMLRRLQADIANFANSQNSSKVPRVKGLTTSDIAEYQKNPTHPGVGTTLAMLGDLLAKLKKVHIADCEFVERAVALSLHVAQRVAIDESQPATSLEQHQFLLQRFARRRAVLDTDYLAGAIISSAFVADVQRINPYLAAGHAAQLEDVTLALMLRCNRITHTNRAIAAAQSLQSLLKRLQRSRPSPPSSPVQQQGLRKPSAATASVNTQSTTVLVRRLEHVAQRLADNLTARRHFATRPADGSVEVDPRFLIFEYIFDILLRKRQVEMVRWFVKATEMGESRVQQMIMGAGKTTVVGPLLALILADGTRLVTEVMPSALLEMSRNVLRSRFAALIRKKVYTFQFDRSCEDSTELVAAVFAKLDSARRHRGVVCAAPEAVKSLLLKFVEQLHSIESFDLDTLVPGKFGRHNNEVTRMRNTMTARSDMADALTRILALWKQGVLVMDEVDVLLHPLRSELNFPIGHKFPIDLAPFRWDLPIHLLDGVFFAKTRRMCEPVKASAAKAAGFEPTEVLEELAQVVQRGYDGHQLQRNPHLVLLDEPFYHSQLKPVLAKWTLLWLRAHFVGVVGVSNATLLKYLCGEQGAVEECREEVEQGLLPQSKKLLNLAADWVRLLMPHVLSKIDRVSYGVLSPADMSMVDPRMPASRKVMAVPFVGKDVPSRASEFAHPDVLIGLTVLAYRYEGLRLSDLRRVVMQLKQDFGRQVGPRDHRPASLMFRKWLDLAARAHGKQDYRDLPVLPLALFQPNDDKQLHRLLALVDRVPSVLHYYLRQHVFPATMNFQRLKISACGHELGSSVLFGSRIGFSGTPSNLLPVDLGECQYEPGSDGRIINCLTSHDVVTEVSRKKGWTAESLLEDVATHNPPVHCLIDTGALITGMDNEEVARFLVQRLPEWMEGVVYLDRQDRQMILLRSSMRSTALAQCGIEPALRFTFYDQVHTTGMDIKQAPNARAVVTVGKDMTFRDYAQGAYRMRGIGKGQTVHLFLIPEVENRMQQELQLPGPSENPQVDVPAWLLINSMRMEGVQFVQMSLQELHNVWRKRALGALVGEVTKARMQGQNSAQRLRRFTPSARDALGKTEDELAWQRRMVQQFREVIGFPVDDHVPVRHAFSSKLQELVAEHKDLMKEDWEQKRVAAVTAKVEQVSRLQSEEQLAKSGGSNLNAEVVHENEAEAEEEAEEEAEQEEQKISAFSRDDEQHNPWPVALLGKAPSCKLGADEPFYRFRDFKVRDGQRPLEFPNRLLLSDNFFRPAWCGLGDRRLKNIGLVLEWTPLAAKEGLKRKMKLLHRQVTKGCGKQGCSGQHCASNPAFKALPASKAGLHALQLLKSGSAQVCEALAPMDASLQRETVPERFLVALSLAEGETLRRIMHAGLAPVLQRAGLALRNAEGALVDESELHSPELQQEIPDGAAMSAEASDGEVGEAAVADRHARLGMVDVAVQALRFFNCEMYYTDDELQLLLHALVDANVGDRAVFFAECLRLRRRERNLWEDTPLAKVFTERKEWHMLRARALVQQVKSALAARKALDCRRVFLRFDTDGDDALSYEELQRAMQAMQLGFSPRVLAEIVRLADATNSGKVTLDEFVEAFQVPVFVPPEEQKQPEEATAQPTMWTCNNCTFLNSVFEASCGMCNLGWTGQREVPNGFWMCSGERGGCTFFNPDKHFYCEICNRARPDLASVRF